jgi:hypothetical protein
MNKHMTMMEAKIDGLKADKDETFDPIESKLEYALDRMEGAEKSTSEKIDNHGLIISSIKRGMEHLYDLNKREEETAKTVKKKINSYEIMLRRILGFHEPLMNLLDHQKQLGRGVQDLLNAFILQTMKANRMPETRKRQPSTITMTVTWRNLAQGQRQHYLSPNSPPTHLTIQSHYHPLQSQHLQSK